MNARPDERDARRNLSDERPTRRGRLEAGADLVVVGSGVAGLTAALDAAELGLRVVVVTKDTADAGCTALAQGGIAVVLGDVPGDTIDAHVADTLTAAAGLADAAAAASIIAEGPAAVARLRARGAVFDGPPGRLARTREGGHSALRVVHAGGDATGAEVERALVAAATDRRLPLLTGHVAADAVLDEAGPSSGSPCSTTPDARGCCAPARCCSRPAATGSSSRAPPTRRARPATASRSRCAPAPSPPTWSSSSSTRPCCTSPGPPGSGRWSPRRCAGRAPCCSTGPAAGSCPGCTRSRSSPPATSSPPRSPGGWRRRGRSASGSTPPASRDVASRFPTVAAACRAAGLDLAREPIPVTPAAHYACGGVVTDGAGRTSVPGLYAAGEVARTGLHGANRLASNSLLEGLVVGARAARAVAADRAAGRTPSAARTPAPAVPVADRATVQRAMSGGAGIGRDAAGLAAASDAVEAATVLATPIDRAGVEDAALTLLAQAVLAAAGTRTESRGCHVRTDFPDRDDDWQRASLVVALDDAGRPVVGAPIAAMGAA